MAQDVETPSNVVKASEVIGVEVQNKLEENLGKIEDVILDKLSGNVRYVVLSFGGFLGMGDKYFALPWNSIRYDEELDSFILDIDKEKLKSAPGFDKDQWPDFSDREWEESIHNYYGYKPYWKTHKDI